MNVTPAFPGPTSHIFVSQRLRLHYADWGNTDAPPLILLHGGRDHCRNWDWIAHELRSEWHILTPDLRGHGDSAHSPDGRYTMDAFVYDLAQLIHQQALAPVSIIAHSLGGAIATRYTGLYPENVRRLISIEGLGPSPDLLEKRTQIPLHEHWRTWVDEQRALSSRQVRRYPNIDEAFARMIEENPRLAPDRARHLTIHGMNQNEDGSYSWKFDNYIRSLSPLDLSPEEIQSLWERITCPTMLAYGLQSWASNPAKDGRAKYFQNVEVKLYDNSGHWVHHDQHEAFVKDARAFLVDGITKTA